MTDILEALDNLFIIRKDCYPEQLDGLNQYKVVKESITPKILQDHLRGIITIGCFQIDPNTNKVKWICFDFDGDLDEEFSKAKELFLKLKNKGFKPLMEFSGRRGYHVWLFIEPIDASIAKEFALEISKETKPHELFPKQDKLEINGFGSQVKLPLGIHRVSRKWSYFFDENLQRLSQEEGKTLLIKINDVKRDKITGNLKKFVSHENF